MVFSSQLFLFHFLPVALAVYYALVAGPRWLRHSALTLLSYAFYGWANPPFVLLMAFSTLVDFFCGLVIDRDGCAEGAARTRLQRLALLVSICTNLGLLGFFKYAGFAVESYASLMEALGLGELAWRN